MEVEEEYARIRALFDGADEKQAALLDGAFWEAARLRAELDRLHGIIEKSGLIKIDPTDPRRQKELPVSRMVVKVRANYLNYVAKLAAILGKNIGEDDLGLDDYA